MSIPESLRLLPTGPDPDTLEAAYGDDRWDARQLGVPARHGRETFSIGGIPQLWLREATKRWCRWRLATGSSYGTIAACTLAMQRFAAYLAARSPDPATIIVIDRHLIDGYVSWLTSTHLSANTRGLSLICMRAFLDRNRRPHWLPDVADDAADLALTAVPIDPSTARRWGLVDEVLATPGS
jgi:hypothetical protein